MMILFMITMITIRFMMLMTMMMILIPGHTHWVGCCSVVASHTSNIILSLSGYDIWYQYVYQGQWYLIFDIWNIYDMICFVSHTHALVHNIILSLSVYTLTDLGVNYLWIMSYFHWVSNMIKIMMTMTLKGFYVAASLPLLQLPISLRVTQNIMPTNKRFAETTEMVGVISWKATSVHKRWQGWIGHRQEQYSDGRASSFCLLFDIFAFKRFVRADYCLVLTSKSCDSMIFLKTNVFFSCLGRLWTGWWVLTRRPFCSSSLLAPPIWSHQLHSINLQKSAQTWNTTFA